MNMLAIETNDPLLPSTTILNQMLVYIPGQFYGTVTDCNTGIGLSGVTVTAEDYTTSTDATGYYELYVDENTYDVEFSLLGFESAIVVDTFAAEGIMTEISLSLCETPYAPAWVTADPNEADTECLVEWSIPMGPYEIIYDDGTADDYLIWTEVGGGYGVGFTPAGYPAKVTGGRIYVGDGSFPGGTNFLGSLMSVGVMDDDGVNGLPGTLLDSVEVTVDNYGWVSFENYFDVEITDGDFYIVMWQIMWSTSAPPIGVDTELPTTYRSVVLLPGASTWSISPVQDFMIRAIVDGPNQGVMSSREGQTVHMPKVTEGPFLYTGKPTGISGTVKSGKFNPVESANASRDLVDYTVARVSDFNPNAGPQTGVHTPIVNSTTNLSHLDTDFGGLAEGFYAYAVKANYESNVSEWAYSNIVAHGLDNEFTVVAQHCDGNTPDGAVVILIGNDYPYQNLVGITDETGIVVFDSVIDGIYDLYVEKVGYTTYEHLGLPIFGDDTYTLMLIEHMYKPRNLYVDPLTSKATWEEPHITALETETFEGSTFPPTGWQSTSLGQGWFRSDDGGSTDFAIPAGDGFYAVTNTDMAGSNDDGTMDYLVTPELDLRESDEYVLSFSSFYTGAYDQLAFIEYSMDAGATWEVLEQMSPASSWTEVEIDLSAFSGASSSPIWLAFHSSAIYGSGWAVDNVVVQNGLAPVIGYWVYLDGVQVAETPADVLEYIFMDLQYGQTYTAEVRALYACSLSEPAVYTWGSTYLHPPRNLYDEYVYGTNEVPLFWNPPMTGTVPMMRNLVFETEPVNGTKNYSTGKVDAPFYSNPTATSFERSRDYGDNIAWISDVSGDLLYTMDLNTYSSSEVGSSAPDPASGDFMNDDPTTLYVSANWGEDLYAVDVTTGAATYIAAISDANGVNGMACDKLTNTMYVGIGDGSSSSYIGTIDLATGVVTTIGAPSTIPGGYLIDIAIDGTGQMYGWSLDDESYLINKETGEFTVLGSLGYDANYGQGGNWSADDDIIYLTAYDNGGGGAQLRILDRTTGGTAVVSSLPTSQMTAFGVPRQGGGGPTPGGIPDGLLSFNLYRDAEVIANIPYDGEDVDYLYNYIDNNLMPGEYAYDVSAVYNLADYGFPGETAESGWEGTVLVNVVWGNELPFFEGWDLGTFEFQGWMFNENADNWRIDDQYGNPAPSAEFTWDPLLEDEYTSALESEPLVADMLTEGSIFFDFDIALENRNATGEEKLLVEVYNGSEWTQVAEFVNNESFDFTSSHIDITNYAMSRVFQVRFNAVGMNSFDVVSWFVDNISIYRVCQAPTNLTGEYVWNAAEEYGAEVCWEIEVPVPINEWIHWDNGMIENGVGGVATFSIGARWESGQLSDYAGTSITKMRYAVNEGFTSVVLKIWTGANAGTLIYENDVTSLSVAGAWTELTLDTPIVLPVNDEIWVGYTISGSTEAHPAACDAGPGVVGYGDMISTDGSTWESASTYNINCNWNVQFFVTDEMGVVASPMVDNTDYGQQTGTFAVNPVSYPVAVVVDNSTTERAITGFNVYRMAEGATEYEFYDFVEAVSGQESYCYFDTEVDDRLGYYYQVTATYESDTDACESEPAMAYDNPTEDFVYVFITGIENTDALMTNVFPNPAKDYVTVTSSQPMTQITVTNYVGQVVYTSKVNANSIELNTVSYQSGVYIIKIDTENDVITKRVVISK